MTNRTCSIDGCNRSHKGHGYCQTHLVRVKRNGTTDLMRRPSIEERFWSKVDRRSNEDCWPWIPPLNENGYGYFFVDASTGKRLAHRVSYLLHYGEIPDGLELDHLCHTNSTDCPSNRTCLHRRCVNPLHLEPVTRRENVLRSYANAITAQRAKTHCPAGHAYSEHGFNPNKDGQPHRKCRICQCAAVRRSMAKLRAMSE